MKKIFKANKNSIFELKENINEWTQENKLDDPTLINDIKLISVELVTNIFKHSTEKNIFTYSINKNENKIKISLDYGDELFDRPKDSFKNNEVIQESGFGIHILKKICDSIEYNYDKENRMVNVNVRKKIHT